MHPMLVSLLASAALASANPAIHSRAVNSLDQSALAEAQQRDTNATRASSDINIKTSDGRCLSVDKLSGDFRANLTPIQVTQCGAADGQGWDIITTGKHISTPQSMLIVSTTTGACFNFDPRRAAGDQVLLFSCGGRADGSGKETDSQIFPFSQPDGPQSLQPQNAPGKCLTVSNNVLDISDCSSGDAAQEFLFSTPTPSASPITPGTGSQTTGTATSPTQASSVAGVNATQPTAVPRPGDHIDNDAAEEAQQRDHTATRIVKAAKIRGPDGRCLATDPLTGDYRLNNIPVYLLDCNKTVTEWDFITSGKHNDGSGGQAVLLVSCNTQACLSFDVRREPRDRVILFSCGGRADGSGQTNSGQLFPYAGGNSFELAPVIDGNKTCLNSGRHRVVAQPCGEYPFTFTLES